MAERNLAPKQAAFVQEYLVDLNAKQAYIRAGYKARGNSAEAAASRLLSDVKIQSAVTKAQQARAARTMITQDRVLLEYARLAFSDMSNFIEWRDGQAVLKASDSLSSDDLACVSEVVYTWSEDGGRARIKLHDKKGALDSVARHLGMFEKDNQQSASTFMKFILAEQPLPSVEQWEEEFSQHASANGVDTASKTNGDATVPGA